MSHSYAGPYSFTCHNCRRALETALWMIIDTAERPDLAERIRDGTIHAVTCSHCGAWWPLDVPLLIYQPVAEPHVLFSPAQRASAEDNRRDIHLLVGLLRQQLADIWRDEWVSKGIHSVPRSELTITYVGSPDAIQDFREKYGEAFEAFRRHLATPDGTALAVAVSAWDTVLRHPGLSSIPLDLRVFVWKSAGLAYLHRYRATSSDDDLHTALALWQQALDAMVPGSPDRSGLLDLQGSSLHERYLRTKRLDDLDEVIRLRQEAVQALPANSPDRPGYLYRFGLGVRERYDHLGRLEDLTQAIQIYRQAIDATPSDSPGLPGYLNSLGAALGTQYQCTNRLDDLVEAVQVFRQAVNAMPAESPKRANYLNNLRSSLRQRYAHTNQLNDLDEAIQVYRQTLDVTPAGSPDRPGLLSDLGNGLQLRSGHTQRFEDLDEAIQVYRQALDAVPADSPELPIYLYNLGSILLQRYDRTSQLEDLDEAIRFYRQAIAGFPDQPVILEYLGRYLKKRYERLSKLDDLEEAIQVFRQAVDTTPPGSPSRLELLTHLGTALSARYQHTHVLTDLEEAIRIFRQTMDSTPAESPNLPLYLQNLGTGLIERYKHIGNLEDLDEAVQILRHALAVAPAGSPNQLSMLNNLGFGLSARYDRSSQLDDLEQAICVYRQALDATPAGSSDRPVFLRILGFVLRLRYRHTVQPEDLDEAISVLRQALDATPAEAPGRPIFLNALGLSLLDLHHRTGRRVNRAEAIEEAIRLFREAVDTTPADPSESSMYLNNLGNSLVTRYFRTGALHNLEEAIHAWQEAVDKAPVDFSERPMFVNDLGWGLRHRYARTGRLDDLDQAIRLLREAVQEVPTGSPGRLLCLSNLGLILRERYRHTTRLEDLEEAMNVSRQAVDEAPAAPSYPFNRPMYLNNLGNCLQARYAYTEEFEDLEEAIRLYREALNEAPAASTAVAAYLNSLGAGLHDRYNHTRQLDDLEEAIEVFRQALDAFSPDSPDWPSGLNNLGSSLSERYKHTRQPEDLAAAQSAYRDACARGLDVAPEVALHSAHNWGNWALDRWEWEEAIEAYRYGLQAIERLLSVQFTRSAKETWMSDAQGLPARAAYALARTGDHKAAVEVVENGRVRLLAEALEQSRRNLERLPELDHAAVYERYCRAADHWQGLQALARHPGQPISIEDRERLGGEALNQALTEARLELDTAINAIRQVPGYEDFFRPLAFERIQQVPASGVPLVYLVVTPTGSVALVVAGPGEEPAVLPVWLDERTEQDGPGASEELAEARLGLLSADNIRQHAQPADRVPWQERMASLDRLSRWLWDACVGPLVEHLAARSLQQTVLIPTGLLDRMPLHATWTEDPTASTGRRYALETVAFSYAPSARALAHAQAVAATVTPDAILAIDNPDGSLPFSRQEVEAALSHFPKGQRKVLPGGKATHAAVIGDLPNYPVLHFATHGQANLDEPLDSSLLVAGEPPQLTLRDILDLRLGRARLAILSACETGIPGARLPDEVVGLPAGLVQAGVAGVVASLWSVDDESTAMLMEHFYRLWLVDGMSPAMALRSAQIWLRDVPAKELAAYFEAERRKPDYERPLSYEEVSAAWRRFVKMPPEARPFAHPYYWAAFTFSGV